MGIPPGVFGLRSMKVDPPSPCLKGIPSHILWKDHRLATVPESPRSPSRCRTPKTPPPSPLFFFYMGCLCAFFAIGASPFGSRVADVPFAHFNDIPFFPRVWLSFFPPALNKATSRRLNSSPAARDVDSTNGASSLTGPYYSLHGCETPLK